MLVSVEKMYDLYKRGQWQPEWRVYYEGMLIISIDDPKPYHIADTLESNTVSEDNIDDSSKVPNPGGIPEGTLLYELNSPLRFSYDMPLGYIMLGTDKLEVKFELTSDNIKMLIDSSYSYGNIQMAELLEKIIDKLG